MGGGHSPHWANNSRVPEPPGLRLAVHCGERVAAAPPLLLMGMAELVIELVPLVLPVTVLLFGWFAGAWLE